MTVRTPSVEREQGAKHSKTNEHKREEYLLKFNRNVVHLCNFKHIHCCCSASEINSEYAEDKQCRTTHKHKGKLHGRILLMAAAPYTDKQVHRDKGNLVEHEHREHVGCNEEAIDTCTQQCKPKEILLRQRLKAPRSECSGKYNDA